MNADEQRGYSRGYYAGQKRVERQVRSDLIEAQREDFRQRAALVALAELMRAGTWGTTKDGVHKPYNSMPDYADAAFKFADYLARHANFTGVLLASAIEAHRVATGTGAVEDESAVPEGDAQ